MGYMLTKRESQEISNQVKKRERLLAEVRKTQKAKYPAKVLDQLLTAGEIDRGQYERLKREVVNNHAASEG